MKKAKAYIIVFILAFLSLPSFATHLIGGYMSYRYVGPLPNGQIRYLVTLNIYRDCLQSTVDFDDRIEIGVYFNNVNRDRFTTAIFPILRRKRVEPPGNIDCDFYKQKLCIEEGFYQGYIDVSPSPVGYLLTYVRCCRNIQSNLPNADGSPYLGQTYYCQIPPTNIPNSSPFFSGVPSPYMCAKDTTNILNSAVDPDGDSLVYYIALPYQGGSPTQSGANPTPPNNLKLPIDPVDYLPGYGYTFPFGTGGLSDVNPRNGLTSLYSPKTGSYVVALEVAEYRKGVLLSRVRLDLQIIVLDCPPNNPPRIQNSQYNYEVEAGAKICFDVQAVDKDNDNISITGKGDIFSGTNGYTGPRATITKNFARGVVVSQFCWQTTCDIASDEPYIFAAEVWDDGCPPKFDNKNFNIKVKPFIGADGINGPNPVCNYSKNNVYTAQNISPNSTFEWIVVGGTITGNSTGPSISVTWQQDGTGKITMTEISQYGCRGNAVVKNITILPSPPLPKITGRDTLCLGTANEPYQVTLNAGSAYTWFITNGTIVPNSNNATATFNNLGTATISVVERTTNGCPSDTAVKRVNVRKPEPEISGSVSVCPNVSGIEYNAQGSISGSTFTWNITGGTQATGGNSSKITVNWGPKGNGVVEVVEKDRFGCTSNPIKLDVVIDYVLQGSVPVGDISVCEFDAGVPYSVIKTNKSVYYWDIVGGAQATGDTSHAVTVNWGATGNGRVGVQERSYDPVNKQICASVFRYLDVRINPLPVADRIQGEMDRCQGPDTFAYVIGGFAGSTYEWKLDGVNQNEKSNTFRKAWILPGTYKLSVRETTKDTCPGKWIDTLIYIRPKPVTQGIFGLQAVCLPNVDDIGYKVSGFANSTYNWQVSGGSITKGTGTDSITVNWNPIVRNGLVSFHEISEFGCLGDTLELPVYINDMQVEMRVVSVGFPDNRIHLKWTLGSDKLNDNNYIIQRKIAGAATWQTINSISPAYQNYTDIPLNTDNNPFDYQVIATDICGNQKTTNVHTNIWLSGTQSNEDLSLQMSFTPYFGWKNGVNRYEMYNKINDETEYKLLQSATPGTIITIANNTKSFQECYRIKAFEQGGNNEVSWSNDVCFYFSPNVFIPNAFTPNRDNLNETFKVVPVAVNDFEIDIYNRWGEKVYNSKNVDLGWDGNYQNAAAQAGVYMYIVRFTDFENRSYLKSGTLHLIR